MSAADARLVALAVAAAAAIGGLLAGAAGAHPLLAGALLAVRACAVAAP